MIRSLRKKFVLVAMCSTFVVLFGIMSVVLFVNYGKTVAQADLVLDLLAKNGGEFPKVEENLGGGPRIPQFPPKMSPETPFETRFFSVVLDKMGNPIETHTGNIAAIKNQEAEAYAKKVAKEGKSRGFYGSYRYLAAEEQEQTRIIFVDCTRELNTFHSFFMISFSVSFLGLFLVLVLVLVSSKIVFRPVAQSYEKQKQFITDASHELKTPLTIIDANTEVLEMMEGENEWTVSIRNQIKRLTSLTQQMVDLTRMEESSGRKEMNRLLLSEVVETAAEPFVLVAEYKGKKLELDIEPQITCQGNEELLMQLVSLLLDNAVKYSVPSGTICLSLHKKGKKSMLQVCNQTEELPTGNLDILFERFYRTDASRSSQTGGSGIGLSVAKAIVTAHKGKIHAFSEDGKSIKITALW